MKGRFITFRISENNNGLIRRLKLKKKSKKKFKVIKSATPRKVNRPKFCSRIIPHDYQNLQKAEENRTESLKDKEREETEEEEKTESSSQHRSMFFNTPLFFQDQINLSVINHQKKIYKEIAEEFDTEDRELYMIPLNECYSKYH